MAERTLPRTAGSRPAAATADAPGDLPPTLLLAAEDVHGLADQLDRRIAAGTRTADHGGRGLAPVPETDAARLAVLDVTPDRLELARRIVAGGEPWRGRRSIWFEPHGLLSGGGKLAFIFPGVEPTFEPRIHDLVRRFEIEAMVAQVPADAGLEQQGEPPAGPGLPEVAVSAQPRPSAGGGGVGLELQSRRIIAVSRFLNRVLGRLGVVPDMVAGHSIGEWTGSLAAGVVADDAIDGLIERLQPGQVEVADVTYLALGAGVAVAQDLISGLHQTVVSHDNCPRQTVVCGPPDEIATVAERCRAGAVLAQVLPFRSGFHSPFFAPHAPLLSRAFGSVPLRPATVPLWSATTCRTYPPDSDSILALAARHLVEPVRFRELVLALHDAGARVFVQVGVGNLTGFVADTLHGRDAVAIPANTPKRSGLAQLHQLAAALWVEGGHVAVDQITAPVDVRAAAGNSAGAAAARAPVTGPPETRVWQQRFALDVEPAWADHALFRQAEGWPYEEDRFPLVPMAGIVAVLIESATRLRPGLVAVAVEDVAAFRYLVVEPPTTVTIRVTPLATRADGSQPVRVVIDRHAQGTVVLAADYPAAPPASSAPRLVDPGPSHIPAERLYAERHMFHGPAYQGVEELVALAGNGSRARVRTPVGPGALLDNAGQLMGHWLSAHADAGRLILPTSIERVELFGPHPHPGMPVDCTVAISHLDDRTLRADMTLAAGPRDQRVWCRITGWEDRRFATDGPVFEALKWPERNGMSDAHDGWSLAWDRWPDAATRDLITRRYLGRDERRLHQRQHPVAQRRLLPARVAVKDAVRRWLWARGHGSLFPAQVVVADDQAGRPVARGPYHDDLRVASAQVEDVAVATVGVGSAPGIDVQTVEPRVTDFERVVLTPGERRLHPPDDHDRDTWLTSLWAVKEAAARAEGRCLRGRPQAFEITERRASRARVGDRWVAFERLDAPSPHPDDPRKELIVAWTLPDR